MSQTTLDDDLNILADSGLEITFLNGDLNIIQKLDDEPNDVGGLTSAQLKAKFDESGLIIQKYINQTLIPELLAEDAVESARVSAENRRAANEEIRIANESVRTASEKTRTANENTRIANENARIEAEKERQNSTTGIVAQATAQANEAKKQAQRAEAAASGGNHAARHAADGEDPITPDMIGAAPTGYGLGPKSKLLSSWDDADANGFYYSRTGAPTSDWWFGICHITANFTNRILTVFNVSNNECRRAYVDGAWGEWEWVDPPLELDKEYRTTQRYMGKPVYVKLCSFGQLPASATITKLSLYSAVNIIQSDGYTVAASGKSGPFSSGSKRTHIDMEVTTSGTVTITTTADLSSYTAYIYMKYTKS